MAKITLRHHGAIIGELKLADGHEYTAGRASDAHLHMDSGRGISRHHLKFYQRDGVWICETLSKFAHIQQGKESHNVIELREDCGFTIPPFEFSFEADASAKPSQESPEPAAPASAENTDQKPVDSPSQNLPVFYAPRPTSSEASTSPSSTRANNEATVAGPSSLVPYLRISYPNTADNEILKLEGHLWVAGRDSDSEIHIDSPNASRKHFELARMDGGYFVTDLGSSNGTKINGQKIPPHEPTRILSGDEIRIQNIEIHFEVRDTQFSNRMDRLPVAAFDPLAMAPAPLPAMWSDPLSPAVYEPTEYRPAEQVKVQGWRKIIQGKSKVRLALYVLVPILVIAALLPKSPAPAPTVATPGAPSSFANLSKEQQLLIKDSFNLARTLYTQGKYPLCLSELAKVHDLIPQYENSKELESFCEQGQELKRREDDARRAEEEARRLEAQIQGYVDACKAKLGPESSVEETRQCLGMAIDLKPDHNLIVEMLHNAQMHEEQRKFMAEQEASTQKKARDALAHFNRALAIYKHGRLSDSVQELERFVRKPYPRSDELKEKAKRQIASIRKEIKVKVDSYMEQCKSLGAKNAWRDAYKACDLAFKEDSANHEAAEMRDRMSAELRREMKAIYEDSVLEESLGNVDTAKEKWKKIVADDIPNGEYATKAKSKLRKYGAG